MLFRKLIEKLKGALAPKERFSDTIHVRTTETGTQYISAEDVFGDPQSMEEMRSVTELVRSVQGTNRTAASS